MTNPYTPHTETETQAMLEAVGAEDVEELFDIPESIAFDGELEIPGRSEREVRREIADTLAENDDLVEFLGRGHHDHYVPAVVDDLAGRSEFLSSYTQYQPEITQGFLQALFEYQSMLVELTGLSVANCSMYDAATALGEAALLGDRVGEGGDRVLVPGHLASGRREVLETYVEGVGLAVESYPMADGCADLEALAAAIDEDTVLVYAENPTVRGVIEERPERIGAVAREHGALFCLGSDPVSLALLRAPAAVGADVVVGEADALGLPTSYGTGLGLFACRERYLRQVPGRLVGESTDAADRRAFTLTLQTREQHIRKERATSNICTNQAWVALRTAMHVAALGPEGLVELAKRCVREATRLADRLDGVAGLRAPIHDRHHIREFVVGCDRPAGALAGDLREAGYAVHVLDPDKLQVCVTETNAEETDGLVAAFEGGA